MPQLTTERLTITPLTLDRVHSAMTDPAVLGTMLDVRVDPQWPNADFASVLPIIAQQILEDPEFATWTGLIILRSEATLIGDIGFKSTPDEMGTVEIGYSIVPGFQGHGYATEAARAMINWAFEQSGVQRIVANCLNDNQASIHVLQGAGMRQTGRSGPLLDWVIDRNDLRE